jgi:hypothetical protein
MNRFDEVRVILDLATAGEVIHGSVSGYDRAPRQFFGWLELADALETARRRPLPSELLNAAEAPRI